MNPTSRLQTLISTLVLSALWVALFWPVNLSLKEASQRIQWFHLTDDEAQHTELIERLAQMGKYGEWTGTPFAPRITTGPTVVVPSAWLKKTFAIPSAHAGRIIVFIYHLFTLLCVWWLFLQALKPRPFSKAGRYISFAIATGIFHWGWRGFSETNYYMFGVLGEGAAAFFLLFGVWTFSKRMTAISGAALGLATLSKPIMLLMAIAFFLFMIWHSLKERRFFSVILWVMGFLVPWIFWFTWMRSEMGLEGTLEWWKKYPELMRSVNGAGLPATLSLNASDLFRSFSEHWKGLQNLISTRSEIIAGTGFFFLISSFFPIRFFKTAGIRTPLHSLLAWLVFAQLSWWFLLSPGAQARYLFPALVGSWMGCLFFIAWIYKRYFHGFAFPFAHPKGLVLTALVLLFISGKEVVESWKKNSGNYASCGLCRQLAIQDYWFEFSKNYSRRPVIWTTSTKADKELFLTAPYEYRPFEPKQALATGWKPPVGDWVSLGDFAKEGSLDFLMRRKCKGIFTIPKRNEGFWKCY